MRKGEKNHTLALAGNPNCGKTTLFNALTGSNQKIGNWPGVTVERKEGRMKLQGEELTIVDLPGIYGLSASSEDEMVSRDFLMDEKPEGVINIVDGTNLERNLYLTLQVLEMNIPTLLVLTKMDQLEKDGHSIDLPALSQKLGIPVIGVNALKKETVGEIQKALVAMMSSPPENEDRVPYPEGLEKELLFLSGKLSSLAADLKLEARWLAIRVLDLDDKVQKLVLEKTDLREEDIQASLARAEEGCQEETDIVLANEKYNYIEKVLQDTVKKAPRRKRFSHTLDKIVMNRVAGIPIFLGIMFLVFWFTLNLGGAFIDFFDGFFAAIFVDGLGQLLTAVNAPEMVNLVLAQGIGGGLVTVATFVPIIFAMFFALSVLEDSGYMARAAFVMDRVMRKVGLPGKAFVPMLVGFGCTIPAVLATRTLDTKRDKFTTIFMAPLMSCGARLPVYALLSVALFPAYAGAAVFSLYVVGIVISILTGVLVKKTIFKGEVSSFVMELPPYHPPRLGMILKNTWSRLKAFILRAGSAITVVVLVLTVLNNIGISEEGVSFGQEDTEISVLAHVGRGITPVFSPMGIEKENWPATVGLFTGLFAKEAVVGTLNALYFTEEGEEGEAEEDEEWNFLGALGGSFVTLGENLGALGESFLDPLGLGLVSIDEEDAAEELEVNEGLIGAMQGLWSPSAGYAYLLFILIYFPCVAAFGATIQEMGAKLGILLSAYLTVVAWGVATLFFQITAGGSVLWMALGAGVLGLTVLSFYLFGKYFSPMAKEKGRNA